MIKISKNLLILATIGTTMLASSTLARAAGGDKDIFVGPMIGFTQVSNNVGTGIGFEAEAGYFFSNPFGAGLYIRHGNHSGDISSNFYGAMGLYRLSDLLPGLYVGVTIGAGSFSTNGVTGNSALDLGLKVAYDYFLPTTYPISVGADISLSWTKPGDSTLTMFTPMVDAKWWF